MSDRTVHAVAPNGAEIVRYDRAGKWYAESVNGRMPISLSTAVQLALLPGAHADLGLPGGKLFDSRVRRASA